MVLKKTSYIKKKIADTQVHIRKKLHVVNSAEIKTNFRDIMLFKFYFDDNVPYIHKKLVQTDQFILTSHTSF